MPYITIGGTLYRLRRIQSYEGTVAFYLGRPRGAGGSELIHFDTATGWAMCTCMGCTAFGECQHAAGIRKVACGLAPLPLGRNLHAEPERAEVNAA